MAVSTGPAVQVIHAVPGRLRLRIPVLKTRPALAERVLAAGQAHRGVRSVRVNLACASVVVEGDVAACADLATDGLVRCWLERASDGAAASTPAPSRSGGPGRLGPLALTAGGLALTFLGGGVPQTLALAATGLGALPIVRRAVAALAAERRPRVEQLDAAGLGMMLLAGDVRGAAVTRMLAMLGEEIRERTARRARRVNIDLRTTLGESAWLLVGDTQTRVPVDRLRVGDLVAVHQGEQIPVDGVVVDGSARVTQRALTGESRPMPKAPGDAVFATTRVTHGELRVQAKAVGQDTRAGWVVRTVQQAPVHDSRAADYAEHFVERLVVPTFALAGLAYAATGDAARAAAILIVDFGTGVELSAPASILTTMARAARDGALIKSGRALEGLASADAIVLDKTGTLTHGRPEVSEVVSLSDRFSPRELLALAAAAEVHLRHLIAQAIVRHARRLQVVIPERASAEHHARLGVRAEIGGRSVRVGSYRFLAEAGFRMDQADAHTSRRRQEGHSVAWVAVDDTLAGFIAYHDPPRAEGAAVVAWLRAHGVREVHLATGDGPVGAYAVARALGITQVHPGALPDDKAAVVQELQRRGHVVAVVGDGIDDAPALALADVSISLCHGMEIAREIADVVLLETDLTRLVRAIALAREGLGLIRQNLLLVGAPNAAVMALAAAGCLPPVAARLLSDGSTLLAAGNSLRPLLAPERGSGQRGAPRGVPA